MPGEKRKISKSKGSEPESKRAEVDVQEQAAKLNFDILANIENPNVESLINISDSLKVRKKKHIYVWSLKLVSKEL
jgi:hypothetical protein